MSGWNKFNKVANWVFNIAYLNLIWILFIFVGLVLFGIFPATAAMFAVVRKWVILGERDFNIFSTFWSFYRKDFIKLNGFAFLFLLIGCFLYFNIAFLILNPNKLQFLFPGMILFTLAYVMTILFFFPVFVHFKLKFFQYIKQAFLLAVLSPLELIATIVAVLILFTFMVWIPGIIPLFTGSILTICLIYLSKRSILRLSRKAG